MYRRHGKLLIESYPVSESGFSKANSPCRRSNPTVDPNPFTSAKPPFFSLLPALTSHFSRGHHSGRRAGCSGAQVLFLPDGLRSSAGSIPIKFGSDGCRGVFVGDDDRLDDQRDCCGSVDTNRAELTRDEPTGFAAGAQASPPAGASSSWGHTLPTDIPHCEPPRSRFYAASSVSSSFISSAGSVSAPSSAR